MKKIILFTILSVILILFTDCKSAEKNISETRSSDHALEGVTISGSRTKDAKSRSAPHPTHGYGDGNGRTTAPPPPPPSVVTKDMSVREESELSAPRTAEPPPPPPRSPTPPPTYSDRDVVKMAETTGWGDAAIGAETAPKTSSFTPPPPPPPPQPPKPEPRPKARQLTAGEVNDFSKWDLWTDISQKDLAQHAERWRFLTEKRYAVQVITQEGAPLTNAYVELQASMGHTLWKAKTDNTGKAELWNKMFDKTDPDAFKIVVKHEGKSYDLKGVSIFQEGMNTIQIPVTCKPAKSQVDIAFVVDATGSMGDEITYLKAELNDVIQRVKDEMPDTRINLGSVFYRDTGDKYLTRKSDFSTDISQTINFIKTQNADGGGDYPEAVEDALDAALNQLRWSEESTSRLLFLALDAPPHTSEVVNKKMEKLTKLAAEKGVRIIPIACSGIKKPTEYLMRAMALATNGTYTFLTDDSGIGGTHIKPTTDEYKVELLNDLLVRVITQFSKIPDCDERYDEEIRDIINGQNNQQIVWEYYPNPTKGPFTVQSDEEVEEVFVTDLNGKLLMRRAGSRTSNFQLDISDFPSGVYVVKCHFENDKWESGRIVLVRG